MKTTIKNLPRHVLRATMEPATLDSEARTIDLVWYTGASVYRYSWDEGIYELVFSMEPKAIRMGRLKDGAPLLNSHSQWTLNDVIGVVEKAWIEDGTGRASVRFSEREDVEPIEAGLVEQLIEAVRHELGRADLVLVSDYGKGVCTAELTSQLISIARTCGVPVVVDPARSADYARYAGCSCITPNRSEAAIASGMRICSPGDGLEAAHRQGVVHRDLKSQNIIINAADQIKIIDFGLARSAHLEGLTATGLIMGTPEYMAPEQVAGKKVDERADIYSLGIILYEVFTGHVPFTGESAIAVGFMQLKEEPLAPCLVNPNLPSSLEHVILKALHKEPLQRYRTVTELKMELEHAVTQPQTEVAELPAQRRKPERVKATR